MISYSKGKDSLKIKQVALMGLDGKCFCPQISADYFCPQISADYFCPQIPQINTDLFLSTNWSSNGDELFWAVKA